MNKLLPALIVFIVILISTLFASSKLLNPDFYTSHDGEGHIIRMEEFHEAINDRQIPVRLAKRINYGLGYPFFNFNYPFVYYLGETIHRIGFSFVDSFKIIMIMSVIIGSISVHYLTLPFFGRIASLVSSLFFIFAPYRFLNMYVRGNVAEQFGLALIPLILLSVENFIKKGKFSYTFLIISFSLLILSHNITAMIGVPLGIIYYISRSKMTNTKLSLRFVYPLFVSLMLTAFFWLPMLIESRLTRLNELSFDYRDFFPSFSDLIYSKWGFGPFSPHPIPGKMSPQIGIAHSLVLLILLLVLLFKTIKKDIQMKERLLLFFVILGLLCLILSLPVSKPLWDNVYPLRLVQLPWRFVGFIILCTSISAGYLISIIGSVRLKIALTIIILFLLIYSNRNHIRVNQYVHYISPFTFGQTYGPSTTSKDEHMPIFAPRIFKDPNPNGDIAPKQSGTSKRIIWKSNYHMFLVKTSQPAEFRNNTSYFPGWYAKVNGKNTEINYKQDEFGRLRVQIPKGKSKVEFFFKETSYRLIADLLSLVSFLVFLLIVILNYFKIHLPFSRSSTFQESIRPPER